MNNFYDMTHQPGIDKSKIDRPTLHLSLCSFQGARTYDPGFELCCVCNMFEKRYVNSRGELWIIEAFHLEIFPRSLSLSLTKTIISRGYGIMQPFSFLLFIASLAFALPAKSAEHKLLTKDDFGKTIAKGYW